MSGIRVIVGTMLGVAWFCTFAIALPIPVNHPVTGPVSDVQNEEQVWICPGDPSIVLANHRDFRTGARDIAIARSIDGGATWTDSLIGDAYRVLRRRTDPMMVGMSDGNIVMGHLDHAYDGDVYDSSYIAFLISEDCGVTWTGPYTVADSVGDYLEDKPFAASDRSGGAYDGYLYVSWTRFTTGAPSRVMFAASPDGGQHWNDTVMVGAPRYIPCYGSINPGGHFSQPLAGQDGSVYVFWIVRDFENVFGDCVPYQLLRFNKSTDAGQTWQGERDLNVVEGYGLTGDIKTYSQPVTAADLTGGLHAGNLYLEYRTTASAYPYDADIFFRRSLDTGHTWTDPIRVNDDPVGYSIDQFHNWMVCNEEGILVSVWYDQRTTTVAPVFDVFAAYSYDGGATWTENQRISSVSINPMLLAAAQARAAASPQGTAAAGLIAEYIGLACSHDEVVAVWTDTRDALGTGSGQDVYAATWNLPLTRPIPLRPIGGIYESSRFPNFRWSTSWKEGDDHYRLEIATDPYFGNVVHMATVDSSAFHASLAQLPDGNYFWRVKAFSGFPDSSDYSAVETCYLTQSICACPYQGDFDESGSLDALDLNALIDVLFFGGNDPRDLLCPTTRGDLDGSGFPDAIDLNYLIDHLFFGGDPPCDPCTVGGPGCMP